MLTSGDDTRPLPIFDLGFNTMNTFKILARSLATAMLAICPPANAADQRSASPNAAPQQAPQTPPILLREFPDDPPIAVPPAPPPRAVAAPTIWARGPYRSIQVNVGPAGTNIVGDAANEPSLAIDPTNPQRIVVGWRQFDTVVSNFRQAGYAYSHDGGESWTFPGVIEPGVFRSDPVLEADSSGNFYYLSLTVTGDNYICHVFKSTDGGVTWPQRGFAHGGDKPWIAVDRTAGSRDGHIYVKWQSFYNCCGLNTFTRSFDGGNFFTFPQFVPLGPTFGTLDVGVDGEVYAVGIEALEYDNFYSIVIARATNAEFFEFSRRVDLGGGMRFASDPNPDGLMGQTVVATDHSEGPARGNVYILGSVSRPYPDPMDVMFVRSTDRGENWTPPVRINDDPDTNRAWQWFGTLSVAPNGRLDAVWNDTRSSTQANWSELFYAYSFDAGDTWSKNIKVSPAFNSHVGWPNQDKIGDYYDMVSDEAAANVAYAATFNGEQDVYFLRVGDCNENGVHDGVDLAEGAGQDCNGNGVLDLCDIASGTSGDMQGNGIPDECNHVCADPSAAYVGDNFGSNEIAPGDDVRPACASDARYAAWFAYTAVCSARHRFTTVGSALRPVNDTVLSVFDACGGAEVACDDNGGGGLLSEVTFDAQRDATYFIRVAGAEGNTGEMVLTIEPTERCIQRAGRIDSINKGDGARRFSGDRPNERSAR